ncbi:MAG: A/G-specific adenine glycosylase [Owenweeksia sp.]|nr:A/G-specific adenine glycosylase [Owenweeksia sp.]
MQKTSFQYALIDWYDRHKRDLPWREIDDPYRIWLSEIILQQTRVEQGLPYYQRFVKNYPTIKDLADAKEDQVLKDWEGLGYYSRARNLHTASRQMMKTGSGKFPERHDEILSLKGVGPYTAAAISSFAYNLPHAVVDGNVYRVLSRLRRIHTPINSTEGKKEFARLADEMLYRKEPGLYNQAIMEFGALHCTPVNPRCESCPLQRQCLAYQAGEVSELPKKLRKKYNRQRYFHYALLHSRGKLYLEQRQGSDIWQRLYQFKLVEAPGPLTQDEFMAELNTDLASHDYIMEEQTSLKPHKLSHQTIHIEIIKIELPIQSH